MQGDISYGRLQYLGVIPQTDELYHHGILGMKWGVRHDHYPLNASEHTSAEKKAGWRQSLESKSAARKVKREERHEAKLKKYKDKQMADINKRYDKRIKWADDMSQAQKEYSAKKEAKHPNRERLKKKNARIQDEFDHRSATLKDMKNKEVDAVMKMSYKDMKDEKRAVRRNFGKRLATALLGYETSDQFASNVKQGRRIEGSKKRFSESAYSAKKYRETHGGEKNKHIERAARKERSRERSRKMGNALTAAGRAAGIAAIGGLAYAHNKYQRAQQDANYRDLASRGRLLEQERFKKAKVRRVR